VTVPVMLERVELVAVPLLVPVELVREVEPEKVVSVAVIELEMVSVVLVSVSVVPVAEVTVKVFDFVVVSERELVGLVLVKVVADTVVLEVIVDEVNEVVVLCVLVKVSVVVIVAVEVVHMLTETCSSSQLTRGGHSRSSSGRAIFSPEPISSPVMSIGTTIKLSVPTGYFTSLICASYAPSTQQPSNPPSTPILSTVASGSPSFVP